MNRIPLAAASAAALLLSSVASAQLAISTMEPGMNAGHVAPNADIVLHFDRPIDLTALPPTTDDVTVFGKSTGPAAGVWTLENGGTTARFTPQELFAAGEVVQVSVSNQLLASDGSTPRSAGYHYEFRVRTRPNTLEFTHLDTINVRSNPSQGTRVYGGQASDLNDDGWVDLAIINQDTSDVRVLPSLADGTGAFAPFLTPPAETGSTPSPNESCDMNGDGLMDIVTGDKTGDTVSVLIGRGDGTFDPRVSYAMGDLPRGLAVFDMDGDGDTDVVCANANSGDLSIRRNNGDGTLGPETTMQGGGTGEWGLASGDMNGDAIMDMVVGAQGSQRLIVWLGNGDGTFTQGGTLNNVDRVWMVVLGDVNGDGHLDVSTGNGGSSTGTIAFGDGAGNLSLGQIQPTGSFVVATDLGDLDGDGDLDWIISSFGGGRWTLYENDGTGHFTERELFQATNNPACALMVDIDRDLDLDIVLLDEIADDVVLFENTCPATSFCTPTANSTGTAAEVSITGSCVVAENDLTLHVGPMPGGFGFLFYGQTQQPPGAVGNGFLCLANPVFRTPTADSVGGVYSLTLDLANPPAAGATVMPGSTWSFQGVFRDLPAGGAQFNFSGGLELMFL